MSECGRKTRPGTQCPSTVAPAAAGRGGLAGGRAAASPPSLQGRWPRRVWCPPLSPLHPETVTSPYWVQWDTARPTDGGLGAALQCHGRPGLCEGRQLWVPRAGATVVRG